MATLSEITKKLSEQTEANAQATRELNKSNITLRSDIGKLTVSVDKYATREKRVQFLENVLDTNSSGLADTFKETLMGPLTNLADAIPGKQFLMPLFKLAAQRTPLRGMLERRRDSQREKLQTEKATQAVEASGMQFSNEEEKKATIERVKLEMAKKEQEEQIKEKNKQIADMLGVEIDKFHEIIGKTEKVQDNMGNVVEKSSEQSEKMSTVSETTNTNKMSTVSETTNTNKMSTVSETTDTKPTKKPSPRQQQVTAMAPGGATDNSAAMVENQRDQERGMERRHKELLDALKGGSSGGGEATVNEGDGTLKGVGGVLQSIGKGFKYLGKNLKEIAKGALAIALMGASLIPFAISAMKFNDVEWESMAKAGVALVGLAGVAFLLGKASGSMIVGAGAILVLSGALWVAGKAFQQFAELDWKTVGLGLAAILGLGAVAAILSFASPLIIAGSVAIGALGVALIPFAFAASLAAPAMTEIAEAMGTFADVPISTMFAIPAALAAIGAALVAMSGGNFIGGVLDGIGKLFGNESPIDKIVRLGENASSIINLGVAMRGFGGDVDAMNEALDKLDPSKIDKLDELGDKVEDFVDKMPGLIGQAKLAAFALSFASIAASAGVAPAVAQGVADATGEVIEVQEAPKTYIAKRQKEQSAPQTADMEGGVADGIDAMDGMDKDTVVTKSTDSSVPEGMVKIKYKGETHIVKKEDAEKVQAINNKLEQLGERSQELNQMHKDTLPHQKLQRRKIQDANRQVVAQSVKLEQEKTQILSEITGQEAPKPITQQATDSMTAASVEKASAESASVSREAGKGSDMPPTIVNAPTTTINSKSGGGGSIMPVPMSEPDNKTRAMLLNSF